MSEQSDRDGCASGELPSSVNRPIISGGNTDYAADASDRTLSSLGQFPRVRAMFMKYNVALPSSAPVERLFSVGGMICTAKRNRLRPELFEKLLLQRVNNMAKIFQ